MMLCSRCRETLEEDELDLFEGRWLCINCESEEYAELAEDAQSSLLYE
jgi:formylmethanofuran dehydrogenase subunit E